MKYDLICYCHIPTSFMQYQFILRETRNIIRKIILTLFSQHESHDANLILQRYPWITRFWFFAMRPEYGLCRFVPFWRWSRRFVELLSSSRCRSAWSTWLPNKMSCLLSDWLNSSTFLSVRPTYKWFSSIMFSLGLLQWNMLWIISEKHRAIFHLTAALTVNIWNQIWMQVHLNKFEYRGWFHLFVVVQFKKWNSYL